jgi:hypothetical protein
MKAIRSLGEVMAGHGNESEYHRSAKESVARMLRAGPGYLIICASEGGRWSSYRMDTAGTTPVVECGFPDGKAVPDAHAYYAKHGRYPKMIFDIGLVKDGKVVAAIEVVKAHWIDAAKQAKINEAGIPVIEVSSRTSDWMVDDVKIQAETFTLPLKPALPVRRMRIGDIW